MLSILFITFELWHALYNFLYWFFAFVFLIDWLVAGWYWSSRPTTTIMTMQWDVIGLFISAFYTNSMWCDMYKVQCGSHENIAAAVDTCNYNWFDYPSIVDAGWMAGCWKPSEYITFKKKQNHLEDSDVIWDLVRPVRHWWNYKQ